MLVVVIIAVAFLTAGTSNAQDEERRYFPETGHWVYAEFLDSYTSVTNPLAIFGNPITEVFHHKVTNRPTQYFERAVFELHPESELLRVVWKPIGELSYKPGSQVLSVPPNFPACQTYDESGQPFQICYAFLNYFKKNGGVAQFGYPISNIEVLEGRIVQWFQRARFEWHPELAEGQQVVLAKLGLEYFDTLKEDPRLKDPAPAENLPRVITRLNVRGFFESAVVSPTGRQSLFVTVLDQKLEPVGGATVFIKVHYPSGMEASLVMPMTNSGGISTIQIPMEDRTQGLVEVTISVTNDTMKASTRTSFRIWW